ncbi:uncharacterized protein BXZ73DRAFT_101870 [Epithele typhae]|uniref:uncharacterized protein n=1 Tax=Epithele typhae TaxID=378194 RepID=UPI002007CD12|nr:uncharacterized protein BXZ73DRAFT_101870 [Epithele typhae]KAH9930499.1 hypothetical protein BXZ73DRAFT_101870 [Epithele typhae]
MGTSNATVAGAVVGVLASLIIVLSAIIVWYRWPHLLPKRLPAAVSRILPLSTRASKTHDDFLPTHGQHSLSTGTSRVSSFGPEKYGTVGSRDSSPPSEGDFNASSRTTPSIPDAPPQTVSYGSPPRAGGVALPLPPLAPNRRPPSVRGVPRLEPNRRKPSAGSVDLLNTIISPVPASASKRDLPPVPKLDLTAEIDPTPGTSLARALTLPPPALPTLVVPRPVRHSRMSAITASTALGDMPLLHHSPSARARTSLPSGSSHGHAPDRGDFDVHAHRALALARLDTVVPPRPPRAPERSPSAASTRSTSTCTTTTATTNGRASARASKRASTASSIVRKPVPALDPADEVEPTPTRPPLPLPPHAYGIPASFPRSPNPSVYPGSPGTDLDGASVAEFARRFSEASIAWGGARALDSPVPSSATSQMYRVRDSAWSEWASAIPTGGSGGGPPGSPWGDRRASENTGGSRSTRQSQTSYLSGRGGGGGGGGFGEMVKPMRTVIPDVPPLPREYLQ